LFLRNFPILFEKNDLPIYLVLKVLEKPKPFELMDQNKISYKDNKAFISIEDFGIGIPEDEIEKVFHSFYRASNTITYQGSGLGLSVAKQFMELHGGKITLTSTLNKGTTVTLCLPTIA
jgi:signal transduction histidine kinase